MTTCNMTGKTANDANLARLQSEVTKLVNDTNAQLLLQHDKIASICRYVKDNLSYALTDFMNEMESKGELDNIITNAVLTTLSSVDTRTKHIINVDEFGAVGDGITNDIVAVNDAIASVGDKPCVVVFPKGRYYLSGDVYVYPNTVIDFNNSKIICENVKFINSISHTLPGYGALSNITFKNGRFTQLNEQSNSYSKFALMHADDVVFENMTFEKAYNNHYIELGGCRNVTIRECHFNNIRLANDVVNPYVECIQIEYAGYNGMPYWDEGEDCYDMLPCKDIRVMNCVFEKGNGTHAPNAIGGHGGADGMHERITVSNCTFEGWTYSAIRAFRWCDVIIRDNYFHTNDTQASLPAIFVENNLDSTNYQGACSRIKILNNTFRASNDSLRRFVYLKGNSSDVVIDGNDYNGTCYSTTTGSDFVQVDSCSLLRITNNLIKNAKNVAFAYSNIGNTCYFKNNLVVGCRNICNDSFSTGSSKFIDDKPSDTIVSIMSHTTTTKNEEVLDIVGTNIGTTLYVFENWIEIGRPCTILVNGGFQIQNPQGEDSLQDLVIYRERNGSKIQVASTRLRPIANYENSNIIPTKLTLNKGDKLTFVSISTAPGATITTNSKFHIQLLSDYDVMQ